MDPGYAKRETPVILIVDDISMNVEILDNIISHEGYRTLCAVSVREAIELMKETKPSLILSDMSMPEVGGLEFCGMLKSNPETRDIPFIFITVLDTSEEKKQAFLAGAVDFIPKPFDEVEVIMRVNNQLNSYRLKQEMEDYNRMMHKLVESQQEQIEREQRNVLLALSKLMQKRKSHMGNHLRDVGYNCGFLAQGLQLLPAYENAINDEFVETIEIAAQIHDIGSFILQGDDCTEPPNPKARSMEYKKDCAREGAAMLKEICEGQGTGRFIAMALRIAECHHAHWDGTGYPALKGTEIPLEARITALANDFDHLMRGSDAVSVEDSIAYINEMSGSWYDPDLVKVFNKIWRQMKRD